MIDRETIMKALECCIESDRECVCPDECPFAEVDETNGRCDEQVKVLALGLLKEQEAVEPTWQQGKAYCGLCGKRIPLKIGARYCHKCGQKVKWE